MAERSYTKVDLKGLLVVEYGYSKLRGIKVTEVNSSIIQWINSIPDSDQEVMGEVVLEKKDPEMELLIDLLKEGRDMNRLRELYRKLANDLDNEEFPGQNNNNPTKFT